MNNKKLPKKPEISTDFTIEDIHKIREWNAKRLAVMGSKTFFELMAKEAEEVEKEINSLRK
ncbi:MAG: hypothetical protein LBM99_03380 [Bacillales bacterium]|jgi:hypothetical protein|nr:hypothetical protein [Bacillales bacterium]